MDSLYSLYFLTLLCIGFSFCVESNTFNCLKDIERLTDEVNQLKVVVGYQQNELNRYRENDHQKQETERQKEERLQNLENKVLYIQDTCQNVQHQHGRNDLSGQQTINRLERLLMASQSIPGNRKTDNDIIAFYAIMSHRESNPGGHHILVFDDTKTNEGKAYSSNTGSFTAPKDGVYVFVWRIRMYNSGHSTELVVNQTVYGATYMRQKNGDDGSVTGTVVVHLSQGYEVFVRTRTTYAGDDGDILSDSNGYSSFIGWKLN